MPGYLLDYHGPWCLWSQWREKAELLVWLVSKGLLVRASYMPGQEPERGGRLTDYSAGHPEWRGPTVFRQLVQLSTEHYGSATTKDLPCRSLQGPKSKQSTVHSGNGEKGGFDTYPDSHPNLDL